MKTLNIQRLLFLILAFAIVLSKVYVLLIYEAVYYLSFEFLNSKAKYRQIKYHKTYNWLFVSYLAFEVLVRADLFDFTEIVDYHINSVEHLFFTFLISLSISIYMHFFGILAGKPFAKLMAVFTVLNCIGIINEYFQNWYQDSSLFYLEAGDIKDININLIGSLLFVVVSIIRKPKKMLKLNSSKIKS